MFVNVNTVGKSGVSGSQGEVVRRALTEAPALCLEQQQHSSQLLFHALHKPPAPFPFVVVFPLCLCISWPRVTVFSPILPLSHCPLPSLSLSLSLSLFMVLLSLLFHVPLSILLSINLSLSPLFPSFSSPSVLCGCVCVFSVA